MHPILLHALKVSAGPHGGVIRASEGLSEEQATKLRKAGLLTIGTILVQEGPRVRCWGWAVATYAGRQLLKEKLGETFGTPTPPVSFRANTYAHAHTSP